METHEEIRQQILAAAEKLFLHYGYNKTTMAEIAKDCNMSPGNIYRYYQGKKELAVELAKVCLYRTMAKLNSALAKPGLSAAEKLELFFIELVKDTHDMYAGQPKVNELVDYITKERFDLIQMHKDMKIGMIAKILQEGVEKGEFKIKDVNSKAEYICMATIIAGYPAFMDFYPLPELKRLIRGIIQLLIQGISN